MSWRAFVREGDTVVPGGGKVQPRSQQWPITYDGKRPSFEGDPVYCNTCQSWGETRCVGPRHRFTGPDGRQINLDDDLCICKCKKSPRLRASSRNHGMYFGADDSLSAAYTPTASVRAASSDVVARFDQHFVVYDKATERPATGFSYGITTPRGEHHHILDENGATTKADAAQAESLTLAYLVQTTIGVRQ